MLISSFACLSPFGKVLHRESHSSVSNQHSCTGLLTFQCFINSIITSSKLLSFPLEAISCPLIFLSSVCVSSVIDIVVIPATIGIDRTKTIYALSKHAEHNHYGENKKKLHNSSLRHGLSCVGSVEAAGSNPPGPQSCFGRDWLLRCVFVYGVLVYYYQCRFWFPC